MEDIALSNEAKICVCVARTKLCDEDMSRLASLLGKITDWKLLQIMLIRNKLSSYFMLHYYKMAREHNVRFVPQTFLVNLIAANKVYSMQCQLLEQEILNLAEKFALNNIRVVVSKGNGIAKKVYQDDKHKLRFFGDIDILVLNSDVNSAHNILVSNGYSAQYQSPNRMADMRSHLLKYNKDSILLEMHQPCDNYLFRLDRVFLAARADNDGVYYPDVVDMHIHACVHAKEHYMNNLYWLTNGPHLGLYVDIRESYLAVKALGRENDILPRAKDLECEDIVCAFTSLAEYFLGSFVTQPYPSSYDHNWCSKHFLMPVERLLLDSKNVIHELKSNYLKNCSQFRKTICCRRISSLGGLENYKNSTFLHNEVVGRFSSDKDDSFFWGSHLYIDDSLGTTKFNVAFSTAWDECCFYAKVNLCINDYILQSKHEWFEYNATTFVFSLEKSHSEATDNHLYGQIKGESSAILYNSKEENPAEFKDFSTVPNSLATIEKKDNSFWMIVKCPWNSIGIEPSLGQMAAFEFSVRLWDKRRRVIGVWNSGKGLDNENIFPRTGTSYSYGNIAFVD